MTAAVIGFFSALPQILTMMMSFAGWINKISNGDPATFAVKASEAFNQLSNAKTQEEHANAAKAIADLIAGTPSK